MKRKQFTKAQRKAVYDKTGGRCAYCGCEFDIQKMQVDHIKPIYNGGTNEIDNLLPSCRSCNHYKSTFTLEQFRENLEHIPQVLDRDNVSYRNAKRYGIIRESKEPVIFYFEKLRDATK